MAKRSEPVKKRDYVRDVITGVKLGLNAGYLTFFNPKMPKGKKKR